MATSTPPVLTDPLDLVVSRLAARGVVRRSGTGHTARCPAHDDRDPSLSVRPGERRAVVVRCFRGCEPEAILRALGFADDEVRAILSAGPDGRVSAGAGSYRPQRSGPAGLTVAELARSKGLPERELRDFGLRDAIGRRAVEIPYRDADGRQILCRTRTPSKTLQPSGVSLVPYGLDRLAEWRADDERLIVEGESDCWTGWHHGRAVLGLPGANSASSLELAHVEGATRLYVIQEPDAGGPTFYTGIRSRLTALGWEGEVYASGLTLGDRRIKDLSALHLAVGGDREAFTAALDAAIGSAVLVDPEAEQPTVWADDDTSSWPASARSRVAELEARIAILERGGGAVVACDGGAGCSSSQALREQIAEYKAADELVKHGPFSPDGAQVIKHLVMVASATRTNGKEKLALERSEIARLALGATGTTGEKAVSRALQAYKAYQDDPEVRATLPYRLEWRPGGRKTHIDLVPLTPDTPRSTTEVYLGLARLRRDRTATVRVLDRDDSCQRCHSAEGVESRSTRRCLNESCGHTWHTRPVILGRSETGPQSPSELFTSITGPLPGQSVPASTTTYAGQSVPETPSGPVSLVSYEDAVAAKGPSYYGEAPPEEPQEPPAPTPLPVTPRSKPWRCHCGCMERYPSDPAPGEHWRCDGCGVHGVERLSFAVGEAG